MARTFLNCWIVNDQSITNTVLATGITIDTGEKALKIVPVSGANTSVSFGAPTGVNNWRRMRIKFTAFPTTNARAIAGIVSSGGPNIRINPSGKLDWYIFNTLNDSGTTVLSLNTVYTIEFRSSNVAGSQVKLRINGVDEITNSNNSLISGLVGANDTAADTYTMFVYDYVCDDTAFPGLGGVTFLFPISDNARAAKWTAGTSGTTNLWDAVDNNPPTGKVSPQTTTSAITHAGGGAGNEDYDANMTVYTSAGIGASDTIAAMQAVVAHGEDIATGTKTLTFAIKSNPAGSFETAFNAGGDVGAVGAYATNWTITRGTIINSPTVTVGSSAVMSVRRNSTESRLADVCFMGIFVDYSTTPATFRATPPRVLSQSIRRASLY